MAPSHSNISSSTWEDNHNCVQGYLDTCPANISAHALALYPDGVESPEYQYSTLTSDIRITCPNKVMANILSKYFKSPVYRYVLRQRQLYPINIFSGIPFKCQVFVSNATWRGFFYT